MSDGFGGALPTRVFGLHKTCIRASPVCTGMSTGYVPPNSFAFLQGFDYCKESGMSFLQHALQYFE
jgi:hypothetical protein